MIFETLLFLAKQDDPLAMEMLLKMYKPLLLKAAIVNGVLDEDLYQEVCLTFMLCVKKFRT